jgi:plasmid stabilization system protein ParE
MIPYGFHPQAQEEYDLELDYYGALSTELEERFVEDIRSCILQLREFPESAPLARGQVRARPLDRFPITVFYDVLNDTLRILAVAHEKRRPFYWWRRT